MPRDQKFVVVIVLEDTNVFVLCLAFKSFIPSSMFIKCSFQTRVKYMYLDDVDSNQLPPCDDSLRKHAFGATYQAAIWKRSLQRCPEMPLPLGCGWCNEDGGLAIDWMDGLPVPKAFLELLSCQCSRSCLLPSCSCMVNSPKSTDLCCLQDCTNR